MYTLSPIDKSSRKHITLFVRSFEGTGGAERVILNLGCGLCAQGHKVDLLMARCTGLFLDQIPPEINVVNLKVHSARQSLKMLLHLRKDTLFWLRMVFTRNAHYVLGALPDLVEYLKRERPDALISSMDYPNAVAVLARDLARVSSRVILTVHTTLSEQVANSTKPRIKAQVEVNRRFYPRADAVVTVSQGVADDLARVLGLPVENFTTIYNPVVSDQLFRQAAEHLSHPWFRDGEPPVILSAGGLRPAKDHMTLLYAFSIARLKRPLRLIILGEGKLRGDLTRQAEELGISADLDLPGFVNNPYQYMKHASLFVLSSVLEGFSMVLIEAMVCGCPVVSTDCPNGPKEILENGRFGVLVPAGDAQAMASAILHSLDDPIDESALIERGRAFSIQKAVKKYLDLIDLQ